MNELDALEVTEVLLNELLVLACEASELALLVDAHERRIHAVLKFAHLLSDKLSNEQLDWLGVLR
jgi:hypothetical protein